MFLLCHLNGPCASFWVAVWCEGGQKRAKWSPNAPKLTPRSAKMSPKSLKSELQESLGLAVSSWELWSCLGTLAPTPKYHPNGTKMTHKKIRNRKAWENIQNVNVVGVGVPTCSLCSCLLFAACWVSRSVELSVYAFPS